MNKLKFHPVKYFPWKHAKVVLCIQSWSAVPSCIAWYGVYHTVSRGNWYET